MPFGTIKRTLFAIAAALLIVPAFAADGEGQIYATPSWDLVDDDPDRNVNDGDGFSLAVGYAYSNRWSLEAFAHGVGLDGDGGVNGQDLLELGFNGLAVFNRDSLVSPYLLAGISNLQTDFDTGGDDNSVAGSIGAGVLYSFSDRVGVRLQYRYRNEFSGQELADNIYSVGLQVAFGEPKNKIVDSDGDGIADMIDRCPNTPPGTIVNSTGCEVDSDGDGVADSKDACPSTPAGARVDARGCELDDDKDGVSNSKDACPNTPAGARVDARGCELDDDKDGVANSKDACPNTKAGVRVDTKGCEITDVIDLPGVNFESNSDRLLPGAEQVLNDAAATLRKYPDLVVEVAGHTDSDGAADYNEGLSERRARAVRNYLVNAGANEGNLTVRGYGEAEPVASNDSAAGKAENRRVELRIQNR